MALNARRARFVEEYLIDLNATSAAQRAGYTWKYANRIAWALLQLPEVQEAVEAGRTRQRERLELSQDWVLRRLAHIADSDLRRVFSPRGELLPPEMWDAATAAAIAAIDVETVSRGKGAVEHVAKIKLWDKLRALEMIGRHLGMFPTKVELTGKDGAPIQSVEFTTDDPIEAAKAYQRIMSGE